jgi:hypothetical protein
MYSPSLPPPSGAPDTNDLNVLRRGEISSIFQQSTPNGDRQINGIKLPVIAGQKLNITGDAYIYGVVKTPLNLAHGIRFPDGTPIAPSIAFINDPDTGIYRAGDGSVNFTSNGTPTVQIGPALQTFVPITTDIGQNLVLNPSGPSVDFSGKTLINIAGISTDPNRYEEIGATVTTINATPTVGLSSSTISGAAYAVTIDVALANATDGTSSGGFTVFTKAKNIGGTVSLVAPYISSEYNLDPSLVGCTVTLAASGAFINTVVTGLAATTIRWRVVGTYTRQIF